MEATEKNDRKINFIQSDLWKQKKSLYPNKILIPYYLYNDDFVINNPLGSKAKNQAVCNFYYSFPCMPQNSSKLNSVFLACSILSADVKKHGNKCYDALIESIIDLEITGIEINTVTGPKKIHFIMGLMLGDKLGLNCTLGFSKSFSAKYFCRFCLIEKKDSQKAVTENEALLRNRINYREALETETPMEYGIATKSNFNNIPSFHVTENFAIDVMHDLYEGICHLILCKCLVHFIKKMKYLTIDDVNTRIKYFSYFKNDRGTEKVSITFKEVDSCKLKLSARQMMSFCYYFPILFGEYIPQNDEVWEFLLTFFDLIEDLLCYEISDSLILKIKKKN
ncbi:hypothetical protein CVS40_2857 [Lucilia cuprina]|nr:hypothetical protein CVS40_2857 [Lucilia cuprina]